MADSLLLRAQALFVGLPYEPGRFTCGHLLVRAQRELFGRDVPHPGELHPEDARQQAVAIIRHRRSEWARLLGGAACASGDAAVYTEPLPTGGRMYHVGTVLVEAGQGWVLHVREGSSSVLTRLDDMARRHRLEGYYRPKDGAGR